MSEEELLKLIANQAIDKNSGGDANQEKVLGDVMAVLPKMTGGLDVNVRFASVRDFEYTAESAFFELFRITLVHGWLPDPQDPSYSTIAPLL